MLFGGQFAWVQDQLANNVAAFFPASSASGDGHPISGHPGWDFSCLVGGLDGPVTHISALDENTIVFGGDFQRVLTTPSFMVPYVASYNIENTAWGAIGNNVLRSPPLFMVVTLDGSQIFVIGQTDPNDGSTYWLALWTADRSWRPINAPLIQNTPFTTSRTVHGACYFRSNLYVLTWDFQLHGTNMLWRLQTVHNDTFVWQVVSEKLPLTYLNDMVANDAENVIVISGTKGIMVHRPDQGNEVIWRDAVVTRGAITTNATGVFAAGSMLDSDGLITNTVGFYDLRTRRWSDIGAGLPRSMPTKEFLPIYSLIGFLASSSNDDVFLYDVGLTLLTNPSTHNNPVSVIEQYVSTAKSRNLGDGATNSHWNVERVSDFWQPGVITAMAINQSAPRLQLYMGGYFSKVGETVVGNLMMFDGENYKPLSSASYSQNPPVGGFSLSSIVILGNEAYIGGDFLTFSSTSKTSSSSSSSSHRRSVSSSTSSGAGASVSVGGDGDDPSQTQEQQHTLDVTCFARYDALSAEWSNIGLGRLHLGNSSDALVASLALFPDGRHLALAGLFEVQVQGGDVVRNVAAYDTLTDTFVRLGPTLGQGETPYCQPMEVVVDQNSNVYIAGCLCGAEVCVYRLTAPIDGAITEQSSWGNWSSVGRFRSVSTVSSKLLKVRIFAMACQGSSRLYVGGLFDEVVDPKTNFVVQAPNIAQLDLGTMQWAGLDQGTDGQVNVIEYHEATDTLYIGGEFTLVSQVYAPGVALYSLDQWKSLRADELQGWNGPVYALAIFDEEAHEVGADAWTTGQIVGLALGLLAVAVLLMLAVAWAVRKLTTQRPSNRWQYLEIPDDTGKPRVSLAGILADPQIPKVPWESLEFRERVGVGSSGEVHRGMLEGQREVAIKTLLLGDAMLEDEPFIQEFLVEIKISHALKHKNILNFVGVSVRPGSMELALLAEYMERGSLAQLLDRKRRNLPLKLKMSIALDIACGMCYLHNWNPPLIHRDLKPGNCLLNREWVCKIADMGVSTFKRRVENTMTQVGSPVYMSPELVRSGHYGLPADVYSFGVLLVDLFGEQPYSQSEYRDLGIAQLLYAVVTEGLRPVLPEPEVPRLNDLIVECLEAVPEHRPSFAELVTRLRRIDIKLEKRSSESFLTSSSSSSSLRSIPSSGSSLFARLGSPNAKPTKRRTHNQSQSHDQQQPDHLRQQQQQQRQQQRDTDLENSNSNSNSSMDTFDEAAARIDAPGDHDEEEDYDQVAPSDHRRDVPEELSALLAAGVHSDDRSPSMAGFDTLGHASVELGHISDPPVFSVQ